MTALLLLPIAEPNADPILKPKKYHGPIPKKSFGISIGFLGGPNNEQMYSYLDSQIEQALQRFLVTEDFGASPQIDLYYTVKVHPNFAFRANAGGAYLKSQSSGIALAAEADTSGSIPLLAFEQEFNVMLLSLNATALYYFQDASVSEFQAYIGAGFTFFFPFAEFKSSSTIAQDDGTGTIVDTGVPYSSREESDSGPEPGIHGVLGALYHVRNNLALFGEGRYQIGQSKFSLELNTDTGGVQDLNFDVVYNGFVLAIGVSRFF